MDDLRDIMGINWDIVIIIYIYNYIYIYIYLHIFYSQRYDIWVYPLNMHEICMVDPIFQMPRFWMNDWTPCHAGSAHVSHPQGPRGLLFGFSG